MNTANLGLTLTTRKQSKANEKLCMRSRHPDIDSVTLLLLLTLA